MHTPTRSDGARAGLLIALPLTALFAAVHALLQFPFLPFDLFDWLARVLPGGLITFGIDVIVALIAAFNLEDTSGTAKTAEHILALILFVALGYGGGALFFAWARRGQVRDTLTSGVRLGLAIGILMALISLSVSEASAFTLMLHLAWIVALFGGVGLLLGWLYQRFAALPDESLIAQPERRQFLVRVGGGAAVLTVFGAGVSLALNRGDGQASAQPWSATNPLPNADAEVQPAPGTRAEFTPLRDHYRIDINSLPPVVREADWKMQVTGLVENPLALTLEDLRTQFDSLDHFVTLSCISNPVGGDLIGTQRWTGVPLKSILERAQPAAEALYLKISAADGFDESIAIERVLADERIMLVYAWDDLPLTTAHGFPLRIYIPDRYGMKQPKWIMSIDVTDRYEEGYWVRRGWDEVARVNATAVVDVAAAQAVFERDGQQFVPIGGIAYAGMRGISRVEVRLDDSDWREAELRQPLSDLTWVIWRYDWPFQAGDHRVYVRCVDGDDVPQIETARGERPSGATGIHRRTFRL